MKAVDDGKSKDEQEGVMQAFSATAFLSKNSAPMMNNHQRPTKPQATALMR